MDKLIFSGQIISIQPRIRLTRSFDEASHTYLGYAIKMVGTVDDQQTTFSIGIGKAAQAKFNFKVNDIISGRCLPVPDPDMEPVDYYKVSKLAKVAEGEQGITSAPGNWCRRSWRFIGKGDIEGWLPGLMILSVVVAYGRRECRWK